MNILLKNGRIWDGNAFSYGDVLVQGKQIAAIGTVPPVETELCYDVDGAIIAPGLIDIHTHLLHVSCDAYGTPADTTCLPFGVTTAADGAATYVDTAALQGIRVKARVFASCSVKNNHATFELTEKLLAQYGERAIGVKLFFDTSSPDVQDAQPLREVCDFAHSRGLKVMVHTTGSPVPMAELAALLQAGDVLSHAFHGAPHSAVDDNFVALQNAKARGVIIDAGMAGGVHTDFEVLRNAIASGVTPHTVSSDVTCCSSYKRGGRYGLTLCMSIMRALGLDEAELLRAVTANAATAIGVADESGSLAVGRTADIAVLKYGKGNGFDISDRWGHRIQNENGYRCILTIADGQVAYCD